MQQKYNCQDVQEKIWSHRLFNTLVAYDEDWQIAEALGSGIAADLNLTSECVKDALREYINTKISRNKKYTQTEMQNNSSFQSHVSFSRL